MGRTPEPPAAPEAAAPPLAPEIEFIGYAEDCVLTGHIRLDAARLSDLLNDHDEFELVDVHVESLIGDKIIEVRDVVVPRDDMLAVHAVGPRGERGRRVRTRQHPLAIGTGPYHIRGYLHALPGIDPISSFRHRRTMVALTDALIEYELGSERIQQRANTILVNREQVEWVVEGVGDDVETPDLPLLVDRGPLVRDLSRQIVGGGGDRRR
ncbi:MAG TPA: hypothetical protein VK867_13040 [Candidatus Limnocylindrales bacterium]|nr:hypothetical protein [Candidatus Limnocylindrales bacterium]